VLLIEGALGVSKQQSNCFECKEKLFCGGVSYEISVVCFWFTCGRAS
jgi:hypothetical protein